MEYSKADKLLIKSFVQAQRDIEGFYLQALREKNLQKARYYAEQAKMVVDELQENYQDRSLTRWAEEYLRGFKEVEHIKWGKPKWEYSIWTDKIFLQIGKVNKEAVLALVQSGNRAVVATLDGMKKDIVYSLAAFRQRGKDTKLQNQIQSKLGGGLITGKSLYYQKSDLVSFFQQRWLKLRDKSWRRWDPHTYAEMLIRTETARAYNTGVVNRSLQLGTTRFRIEESWNCCSICAPYNGKVVDISKGGYDLPPYHPNCRGTIVPVREEDWREAKIPNDKIWNHLLFDLGAIDRKYWGRESPIWTVNEAVLRNYSGQWFATLNHNLRFWKTLSDEEQFKQGVLDNLFIHLSKPYEKVYRWVNLDIEIYKTIINSKSITDKAFMSSSTDLEVARQFLKWDWKNIIFEINNVKGIDMQKYSNYPQEKEVLLSRGKTYKIKKMTNKGEYLYIVIE